jgi:hypothetical protein
MRWVLAVLMIAPAVLADKAEPEAKIDPKSAEVRGVATVPADAESFKGRILEVRLYRHDPRIADKAADLVEMITVKNFSHEKGKATKKEFSLGKKDKLNESMGYYITLFVLDGTSRTHMGKCDHVKEPFNKVLTNGNPREVKATLNPVK